MSFQVYVNTILWGGSVLRHGVQPDPQKVRALTEMPVPKNKKELQALLGIINYLNKFSSGMLEACKPLRKLTSSKATWIWNASYLQLFNKAKSLIKVEMCMKFSEDTKLHYYNLGTTQTAQKTLHQTTLSFAQLHLQVKA